MKRRSAFQTLLSCGLALLVIACGTTNPTPTPVPPTNTPLPTLPNTPTMVPTTAIPTSTQTNTPTLISPTSTQLPTRTITPLAVKATPSLIPTIKPVPNTTPASPADTSARAVQLANVLKYLQMFDPAKSTSGMRLILKEVGRETEPGRASMTVSYDFISFGLPQGKTFQVWIMSLKDEKPRLMTSVIVDSTGNLTVRDSNETFALDIRGFSKGEPLLVGLMSEDQKINIYGKDIPFPIEATGVSGCRLLVELASSKGDMFIIRGVGFLPNEEIDVIDRSINETMNLTKQTNPNGTFDVMEFPAVVGYESGSASYTATSKSCTVTVNYIWGPAAIGK